MARCEAQRSGEKKSARPFGVERFLFGGLLGLNPNG
jgi:hypothetical protein